VRVSVPDGRVSRAAAEARSGGGRGGEAAAPTSGVTGLNQAPRSRSEAEAERSRRRWAYDGDSPTGARRDRSGDRTDRAEGGKRRHRSGAGAITKWWGRVGRSVGSSPPARRRRAAGEVDGSDESLLSEETPAEAAWPRAKTADGGRARDRDRELLPHSGDLAAALHQVVCDHPEADATDEDLAAAGAGGVLSRVTWNVA